MWQPKHAPWLSHTHTHTHADADRLMLTCMWQVVFGAFAAPIVYSFFFLIVLGSLGIKMQRAAELALNVAPDWEKGMVDCAAMGYAGSTPNSTAAKGLALAGYYPLACRQHADRLFDVLSPYGEEIFYLLGIVTVIGVTLYFVTSSDSGSFVDDTLSAQGMLHCPYPQVSFSFILTCLSHVPKHSHDPSPGRVRRFRSRTHSHSLVHNASKRKM